MAKALHVKIRRLTKSGKYFYYWRALSIIVPNHQEQRRWAKLVNQITRSHQWWKRSNLLKNKSPNGSNQQTPSHTEQHCCLMTDTSLPKIEAKPRPTSNPSLEHPDTQCSPKHQTPETNDEGQRTRYLLLKPCRTTSTWTIRQSQLRCIR